jgi:hypothetical protein
LWRDREEVNNLRNVLNQEEWKPNDSTGGGTISWTYNPCFSCKRICQKCLGLRVVKDEDGKWQVCPECEGEGYLPCCPCPCQPYPYPYIPWQPYYPLPEWITVQINYSYGEWR